MDAFELWCWRRFLRVPWTARRSDQSILKEISSEYSLEGLMLKLQYFGHMDVKNWLIGKYPDGETDRRQEEKGTTEDKMVGWHHKLNGHESEQAPRDGEKQGSLLCCSPWSCRVSHDWVTEQQSLPLHCSCGPSASPERSSWWRSGVRYSMLRGEIISITGLQIVRYFQKKVQILASSHIEKSIKMTDGDIFFGQSGEKCFWK